MNESHLDLMITGAAVKDYTLLSNTVNTLANDVDLIVMSEDHASVVSAVSSAYLHLRQLQSDAADMLADIEWFLDQSKSAAEPATEEESVQE